FAKMDATACDWWGLQATKRNFHGLAGEALPTVVSLVDALAQEGPEPSHVNHLHVSSYFVAYRRSVLLDTGFRALLDSVGGQAQKSWIILRYEIGGSRFLF